MPDPKYQGSDIAIAKRIARKVGPDVERRRMRFRKKVEEVTSAQRRKRKTFEERLAEMERIAASSRLAQKLAENRAEEARSRWAKQQLKKMQQKLLSSLEGEVTPSDIERVRAKYRQFQELLSSLEE